MRPAPGNGPSPQPVSLKAVALPVEHGGWGFVSEPLVLGLLVAPSPAGFALGFAAMAAFLCRHPLKLVLADRLRGRSVPRTRSAIAFAALYAVMAAAGAAAAALTAPAALWIPLAAAAPLAAAQLHRDVRNRGRELVPEVLGAVAPGSLAAAIALAGGWPLGRALVLWLVLAVRAASSILYVRTRLRLDRGLRPDRTAAWTSHGAGLLLVAAFVPAGLAPALAALAFAVLLGRAVHGLSSLRRPVRPRALGFQELGYGLLTTFLLALGYVA